jgi:hypothetical protein
MLGLRSLGAASCRLGATAVRRNTTVAGTLYYRITYHQKEKLALVCPKENVKWTYAELWDNVQRVAGGLKAAGYGSGSVIATDMDNSVSNILLQMAVAHNSMSVLTVKSAEQLDAVAPQLPVQGAIMSSGSSFLSKASFPTPSMDAAAFMKLSGEAGEGNTDRDSTLAYYGSATETTNREVYLYGIGIAGTLEMTPDDMVCVAASLNHPFGLGGAIAAIVRNATIYLPDLSKPDVGDSTILVTDKHKVDTLRASAGAKSKLRNGVVKVSSGFDLLTEKEDIGGAKMWTLGSGEEVFRPLFDACVDKYYTYK